MSTTTAVALDPDKLYEIVDGQPEAKEMPGARHSGICGRLTVKLGMYLTANQLGELYPEGSFQIGANERIPDLAFVSAVRIPPEGEPDTKWPMPPDLAVEVISPSNTRREMERKLADYFAAGVAAVWLVYPKSREVVMYSAPNKSVTLQGDDALAGGTILPGFSIPVAQIFAELDATQA